MFSDFGLLQSTCTFLCTVYWPGVTPLEFASPPPFNPSISTEWWSPRCGRSVLCGPSAGCCCKFEQFCWQILSANDTLCSVMGIGWGLWWRRVGCFHRLRIRWLAWYRWCFPWCIGLLAPIHTWILWLVVVSFCQSSSWPACHGFSAPSWSSNSKSVQLARYV